jgi:hypothetical protein
MSGFKKKEDILINELEKQLQLKLNTRNKNLTVKNKSNLLYDVIIDINGDYYPKLNEKPKRGNLAFQTDLLIKKNDFPMVIIEVKYGRFTTHDVIIYSYKATKHKELYPYLRYGLLVGGIKSITRRFFAHNKGFDFAYALEHPLDDDLTILVKIINDQIVNAENLFKMILEKKKTKFFNTKVEIS